MDTLFSFFDKSGFMPHGMCFLWREDVLYTHVVSDIMTGLAYYGITAGLIYFLLKRDDIPYKWFVISFGILIFTACGTSHLFGVWTIWNPDFGTQAIVKATTGLVSAATAIILWYLMPQVIALPSPKQLQIKNLQLENEVIQRKKAEEHVQHLNEVLEQKVYERTQELENINQKLSKEIQERKQAEDGLKILSRAVEASPNAVIITDKNHCIEYVNPKFTEITGYTRDEVIDRTTDILKSDEATENAFTEMQQAINSGTEWRGETRNKKKDGSNYWARNSVSPVKNIQEEITHYVSTHEDITNEYELNEKLSFQASHDSLTGLINRSEFERRAIRLLSTIKQSKDKHALCFMDLDQFKVINDTCGHIAGDALLRQLSFSLKSSIRQSDTLARLGGDEFAVLIEHCSIDNAYRLAETIQNVLEEFVFLWEGQSFKIGTSIGLVEITEFSDNLTEILKNADSACYMAKDKGRNRIHTYHTADEELAKRSGEMQWVTKLNQAFNEDSFILYAQPIVSLDEDEDEDEDKHYEILIRMVDDQKNTIPPGAFLPAAERYNLISKLDKWVIKNTIKMLESNINSLKENDLFSINLSGHSLTNKKILKFVVGCLEKSSIKGKNICFEITETAAISNLNMAVKFISTLKELGCHFSLDDFGSGLSSFGYLKNLPVDFLKIDGMFVKDIIDDELDRAMVRSINEIGQLMGMKTIAEFVENNDIKDMLKEIGVDYGQGYGIDKPKPFIEILKSL